MSTDQNSLAKFRSQDLQVAKYNAVFAMMHKMSLVDVVINTKGRLSSSEIVALSTFNMSSLSNTKPLVINHSSLAHAFAISSPKSISGELISIAIDGITEKYSHSATLTSGNVSVVSIVRDVSLPTDYVCATNVKSATELAPDNDPNNSAYWTWPTANSTFTNGRQMNDGKRYHLPSVTEHMGVIAPYYKSYCSGYYPIGYLSEPPANSYRVAFNKTYTSQSDLWEKITWGAKWNGSAYTYDINQRTFYNEYTCSEGSWVVYAIRFKDSNTPGGGYGLYTCAFRYEWSQSDPDCSNAPSLNIKVRYLGKNSIETISSISSGSWSSYDKEIIYPGCGHTTNNNTDRPAGAFSNPSIPKGELEKGYYWSSTHQIDVNSKRYYYGVQLYTTLIGGDYNDCDTWPFSVRLFADKE